MVLYVCGVKLLGGSIGHPCARAGQSLKRSGYEYELKPVGGFKNIPFSKVEGKRDEVYELSGQWAVPILKLDSGEVISGAAEIIQWAKDNPRK